MNTYEIELVCWLGLILFVIVFVRSLTRKIKNTEEPQTKNSLFTLMLLIAIPVILFEIIAPIMILIGDKQMPVIYKYIFVGEIILVLVYFLSTQRSKRKFNEKN